MNTPQENSRQLIPDNFTFQNELNHRSFEDCVNTFRVHIANFYEKNNELPSFVLCRDCDRPLLNTCKEILECEQGDPAEEFFNRLLARAAEQSLTPSIVERDLKTFHEEFDNTVQTAKKIYENYPEYFENKTEE